MEDVSLGGWYPNCQHAVNGRELLSRVGASAGAGWRHEAQMLARCADHANIVSLHEVIEDAHYVYIVMEECEGAAANLIVSVPAHACRSSNGSTLLSCRFAW